MSSTTSFQSIYSLANLTAPASGVTHSAKFLVAIVGGQAVTLSMQSQMEFLGDFLGQAMMVDNTANADDLTINEITYGWTRTVAAGTLRIFQYPAVENQNFVFSGSNNISAVISIYDWPAFPDETTIDSTLGTVVVTGTVDIGNVVTVTGTVDVAGTIDVGNTVTVTGTVDATGTIDVGNTVTIAGTVDTQIAPYGTLAPSATTIATGGTAVAVFSNPGVPVRVVNPQGATEPLFVDLLHNAGTVESGSTIQLQPGQGQTYPPFTGTLTANAQTSGHVLTAWGPAS